MDARKEIRRGWPVYVRWKRRKRIAPELRRGILSPHWDAVARTLLDRGYAWYTVRRVIEIAKPFAAYAEDQGARDAGGLSEALVESFLRIRPRTESRGCLRLLLQVLHQHGLLPMRVPPAAQPCGLLDEYVAFLQHHRGTSLRRAEQHRRYVASWLGSLSQGSVEGLQSLTGAAVQRFITARAATMSRGQRKALCAATRTLLRFLYLRGDTAVDLVSAVPVIPTFKLERLPTAIDTDTLERILAAVDRSTPVGRRDYAMLLLLATYGLRAGQLCALRLEDLDWRRQQLRIPGAKGGAAVVVPLRPAVGEALIDYLRHGRPVGWPCRQLFLRVRAPIGPLRGVLSNHIKPYVRKAGVTVPSSGAHAWRHACATRMLATGQSLKTIRHLLGHRSIETTFIYTKVDLGALRQAALEWPEGAS
jgi:integrase